MPHVQISKVSQVPLLSNFPILDSTIINLSIQDSVCIVADPIQDLFFYTETNLSFTTIVENLKSSFTHILPFFHPLAGKLTYVKSSETIAIDCSPCAVGSGVTFFEAESNLDINRLIQEAIHDLEAFRQLVPNIIPIELPAPVCAVQVTKFSNGGVAVGISINHAVMDGNGFWQFIDAWAKTCKIGYAPAKSMFLHDRSVIKSEGDDEIIRSFLKCMFPDLPKMKKVVENINESSHQLRRTFKVNNTSIQALQRNLLSLDPKRVSPPSKFVSLIANAWICLINAKLNTSKKPTSSISSLLFPINLRPYHDPPIDESYTGNCIGQGFAQAPISILTCPTGFPQACTIIENAICKRKSEVWLGLLELYGKFASVPCDTRVSVAGSHRFRAYDVDFGWGRPSRMERVASLDGEIALFEGREKGSVHMSVSVSKDQCMEAFVEFFETSLMNL